MTEFERVAIAARQGFNLADGHARHSLMPATSRRVQELLRHTLGDGSHDIVTAEERFIHAFASESGVAYDRANTAVTYSASISLDIVAKLLSRNSFRLGLITPTFDNLAALMRLAGLAVTPLPLENLLPQCDWEYVAQHKLDAILLVVPNNPTGHTWKSDQLRALIRESAEARVTLILDMSFRLFDRDLCWDQLAYAEEVGADVIVIEDTGKIIPLHDTKLSLLVGTHRWSRQIAAIQTQVLLNVSMLELAMVEAVLTAGHSSAGNEIERARGIARENRDYLSANLPLGWVPTLSSGDSASVAWLRTPRDHRECIEATGRIGAVHLLPGRQFYWDRVAVSEDEACVRVALMRDRHYFESAIDVLVQETQASTWP